jgi:hypothetical protein
LIPSAAAAELSCQSGPEKEEAKQTVYIYRKNIWYRKSILYILANNLYGWAQSQLMPHSGFRWLTPAEIEHLLLRLSNLTADQNEGYILEVDLDYPPKLHKSHSSFPLAPERLFIDKSMLSPYATGIK